MSPALAVIDMQNVFGDAASPWRTPRFDEVVAPVRALAAAYADRAVFTRFIAPAVPTGAWRAYYEDWPFALQPPDAPAWGVVAGLAEVAARAAGTDGHGGTLDAPTFGKWGPTLATLVGEDNRLVVCGVSTDCCVLSTVLAAVDAGVQVLVAADACAGLDDASHAKALELMALYAPLATVVTTAEALALAAA
ncbi:MAG: isochorismatase family protein [Cellulomonas sp.]|nr:isochorismatase family protein [Cellulomonas sp.]